MGPLKELRRKAGLTQQELAIEAGVAISTVVHIEAGRRHPTWATTQRLAKVLARHLDRDWGEVLKDLAGEEVTSG